MSSVSVDDSRIPDAVYTFTPETGKMLTTPWKQEWSAEIGGGYCPNLNNSSRTAPRDIQHVGPVWQHTPEDGDFLRFTPYSNLTFLNSVWPLGAFTVEFEIRPAAAEGILLRHSNPKQTLAIGLLLVDGKLRLVHSSSAGRFKIDDTPFAIPAGKWSRIKVASDIANLYVTVNGQSWQCPRIGRGRVAACLVFGNDGCRDFLPRKDFPSFNGDLRSLRIAHKCKK